VLGRIALLGFNFYDGVAGVAYWVLPAARGVGVATCAAAALSAWALEEIGFRRLELSHSTRNHASCRVAAKSGYLLEGTKRSAAVHDDGRHDMHLQTASRQGARTVPRCRFLPNTDAQGRSSGPDPTDKPQTNTQKARPPSPAIRPLTRNFLVAGQDLNLRPLG
jgi:hypothetical protein